MEKKQVGTGIVLIGKNSDRKQTPGEGGGVLPLY